MLRPGDRRDGRHLVVYNLGVSPAAFRREPARIRTAPRIGRILHTPGRSSRLLRLDSATLCIVETDPAVAAIGRLVGRHYSNYASRRFRHLFTLGPAAYRTRFRPGR
ncbi:hypothetical protein [Actinoallomurus acaciae]